MIRYFKSKSLRLLLAVFLSASVIAAGGCQNNASTASVASVYSNIENTNFVNSPELFELVENNNKELAKSGFAEMRIPKHLHTVTRQEISRSCLYVADVLKSNGFKSYLTGGAVRDLLMGYKSNDFDILTDDTYEQLEKLLPDVSFHTIFNGQTFAYVPVDNEVVDVASIYNCPKALKGLALVYQHPEVGVFQDDLISDAATRDLAFNTLYYDLDTGDIIDFSGGVNSILTGTIKATYPAASAALENNPRSIYRTIRFISRYQMKVEESLNAGLLELAPKFITAVSNRDYTRNLLKMDNKGFSKHSWDNMNKYNVLEGTFPAAKEDLKDSRYMAYMEDLLTRADATYPHKSKGYSCLMIGAALWPAVERETQNSSLNTAINKVLDVQKQIFDYKEQTLRENLVSLFKHEYLMTHKAEISDMQAFCQSDYFAPALDILRSSALNAPQLADDVRYFETMAEGYKK